MNNELFPCPFCGGEAGLSHAMVFGGSYVPYIECCKCSSASCTYNTKKEAINAWNTRNNDEKYKKLLDFVLYVSDLNENFRNRFWRNTKGHSIVMARDLLRQIGEIE